MIKNKWFNHNLYKFWRERDLLSEIIAIFWFTFFANICVAFVKRQLDQFLNASVKIFSHKIIISMDKNLKVLWDKVIGKPREHHTICFFCNLSFIYYFKTKSRFYLNLRKNSFIGWKRITLAIVDLSNICISKYETNFLKVHEHFATGYFEYI